MIMIVNSITGKQAKQNPPWFTHDHDHRYYYILLFYSTILLVSSYEINLNIPHLNMILQAIFHSWTLLLQVDNNYKIVV